MTLAAGSAGTAVGAGLATFVLGSNPVGWVILAGLAMSTVFALGTDLIYQNNIFGLKDKVDWVGHKIDNSIDVVKKNYRKIHGYVWQMLLVKLKILLAII